MEAVILTKSDMKKPTTGKSGSCVTAYLPRENRFVRFVSDAQGSPIPYRFSDRFSLLDIVSVQVLRPCPVSPQTENLLVAPRSFYVKGAYEPGIEDIYRRIPPPSFPRLMDTESHTLPSVDGYRHSLELIRVEKLRIAQNRFGREKAKFYFHPFDCDSFSVTDSRFYMRTVNAKRQKPVTELEIGEAYVAMSIPSEPFIKNGKSYGYYKFIAAIYPVHEI